MECSKTTEKRRLGEARVPSSFQEIVARLLHQYGSVTFTRTEGGNGFSKDSVEVDMGRGEVLKIDTAFDPYIDKLSSRDEAMLRLLNNAKAMAEEILE